MSEEAALRFVPSRVEGLPDVDEVAVHPDRLELRSAGRMVTVRFADIVEWPRPVLLSRWRARFGLRPLGGGRWIVGERDWFHPPSERFFRFATRPPLVVVLPDEPRETDYGRTLFRRVQEVMLRGGFATWDLG